MLNTIQYLRSGKTFDDLNKELAIEVTRHDTLPLVILNYNQIESPKTHSIVRECRGLVLNSEDYSLIARAFPRFFNWGEVADEMPLFNWTNCQTQEKVDGSLVLLYYFDGEWRANTRGSFAYGTMLNTWQANYFKLPPDFTWRDGIMSALHINNFSELYGKLDVRLTYVLEFCSLWNKVVREYKEPCMYLLTCFEGEEEIGARDCDLFRKLNEYQLRSADDISRYVNDHPESTFEGCVVKDDGLRRWKIKNGRYLALHRMKGNNGDNLYLPKNILPWILGNEGDEICTYFPEVTECYNTYKTKVDSAYQQLEALWHQTHMIENQKEFALSIVGKTSFTGVLFSIRKQGKQTLADLKQAWRDNADGILKSLFK